MSTSFKWNIIKLSCFQNKDSFSDVVFDVGWEYTGIDENGNSFSINNNTAIHFAPTDQFVPFSSLTKDIVVGWVESELTQQGIEAIQSEINSQLIQIAAPAIINPPLPWSQETVEETPQSAILPS
jgi:hypothetical protein